jgi:hypothetical protein
LAQINLICAPQQRLSLSAFARSGCRRPRRYPSDTTDAEWALLAPLLPVPAWLGGRVGRPEGHYPPVTGHEVKSSPHEPAADAHH